LLIDKRLMLVEYSFKKFSHSNWFDWVNNDLLQVSFSLPKNCTVNLSDNCQIGYFNLFVYFYSTPY